LARELLSEARKDGGVSQLLLLSAVALLVHAAPAEAQRAKRTHPAWMTGTWIFLDESQHHHPYPCEGDDDERYEPNGKYDDDSGPGGSGRWWIEGNWFVRVMVDPGGGATSSMKGSVTRQRFTRLRNGELMFRSEGRRSWMVHLPLKECLK
jgi:hypothetical protein